KASNKKLSVKKKYFFAFVPHLSVLSLAFFCFHITFYRLAGANQVPVAIRIIDPRNARPKFIVRNIRKRENGFLPAIGVGPFVGTYNLHGMRRIFKWIIGFIDFASLNSFDLVIDADQRVTETV